MSNARGGRLVVLGRVVSNFCVLVLCPVVPFITLMVYDNAGKGKVSELFQQSALMNLTSLFYDA